ncbi:MAG: TonB-dependent receptor [bacterium]
MSITKNLALLMATTCLCTGAVAHAQSATDILNDEIVVKATKKAEGENVQDVPIAMTAMGADQLDALQVRNISSLSFSMPNVALDDIGTARGTANFSIRGLGVNSSIPSIDPTVGVFVDGMYLGVNSGVIFDTFDLESVEVLRGPQGVLFGKNVTGGAVLINTANPSFEKSIKAKFAAESGFRGTGENIYAMGSVNGPLGENMAGKLAIYYNDDKGWFEDALTGENLGAADTFIIRPALRFAPSDEADIILKFEHGESNGDGPIGQSHTNGSGVDGQIVNFDRNSFDVALDEPGFTDAEWNNFIAEGNFDVAFGDGTVTNIFAWREFDQSGRSDIDSSPAFLFHADFVTAQDQLSNELRYAGTYENTDVTAGLFYFQQDLAYDEARDLLGGALTQHGGGQLDHETIGVFANMDHHLSDRTSVTAGLRYTEETKDVEIASLFLNVNSPCSVVGGTCTPDFIDGLKTTNWSPSLGVQTELDDDLMMYAGWKRAFRAGGYNFRNTSPAGSPGPFGDEQVDTLEAGFKKTAPGKGHLNASIFFTKIQDMQREVNLASSGSGVVQIIRNTGDADLFGFEFDGQYAVHDNVVVTGSFGYVDGEYQSLLFDISGDGVIDDTDFGLEIPRLAPVTATIGVVADHELSIGHLTTQASYAYRDQAAYTDNNLGILNEANRFDASMSLAMNDDRTRLTLYGKNLDNNVQHGNDTQLPSLLGPVPLGGTFAPLSKGRVIGLELQIDQ